MRSVLFPLSLLSLLYFTISCKVPRYVYNTPTQNVPVLEEKGDGKLVAYYGTNPQFISRDVFLAQQSSYSRGVDVHSAYALSDHMAIMLNYCYRSERNGTSKDVLTNDSSVLNYNRHQFEMGGGYFTEVGSNQVFQFQVFGGLGYGSSSFTDQQLGSNAEYQFQNKQWKIFVQPALLFRSSSTLTTAFSNRFSWVQFSDIETNYNSEQQRAYLLENLSLKPRFFWEPALLVNKKFDEIPLMIELQFSATFLLSKTYLDYRNSGISIGAGWQFHNSNKKKIHSRKN